MHNLYCPTMRRDDFSIMWAFMFADDGFGNVDHVSPAMEEFNISQNITHVHTCDPTNNDGKEIFEMFIGSGRELRRVNVRAQMPYQAERFLWDKYPALEVRFGREVPSYFHVDYEV